jgi:hypothetical protein
MMRFFGSVVVVLLWWPSAAEAACSGSGQTWTCTAGSTNSQINSAISSATAGATITLQNGSYSFNDVMLSQRDGITIRCETVRGCTLTGSRPFRHSGSINTRYVNLVRVSGFVFSSGVIDLGTGSGDSWIDKFRIDNNTFLGSDAIQIGHTNGSRNIWGVIDHNLFQNSNPNRPIQIFGRGDGDWEPNLLGTGNAVFLENNTFSNGNETLAGSGSDIWHGGRLVVRYNDITNARTSVHGVCHNGPALLEVYNNNYTSSGGTNRTIHHQGSGEMIFFGNTFADTGEDIVLQHYRSLSPLPSCSEQPTSCDGSSSADGNRSPTATFQGYPCWRQPGRDVAGNLRPIYVWNNRYRSDGSRATLGIEGGGRSSAHIVANRDYYEAPSASAQASPVTPFSGITGMGFGTLANRPPTCVTNATEAGGGVGYFATDQGPQGTLYRCSATNTWTVHYTPYAYPHPLVSGTPGPTNPAPPTNVRVIRD